MWRVITLGILIGVWEFSSLAQTPASPESEESSPPKLEPGPEFLTFTVSKAIRGDILQLDTGKELQLVGVKSPNLASPNSSAEYFSKEAIRYTSGLVKDKEVKVTFDRRKTNTSGQWRGYVWLADNELLNVKIVREGYGIPDNPSRIPNEEIRSAMMEAFQAARDNKAGMWKDAEKAGELVQGGGVSTPPEELTATAVNPLEEAPAFPLQTPPGAGLQRRQQGRPPGAVQSDALPSRIGPQRSVANPAGVSVWNRPVFNTIPSQTGVNPGGAAYGPLLQQAPQGGMQSRGSDYFDRRSRKLGRYNLNHDANGNIRGLTPAGPVYNNLMYFESQRVPVDRGK